MELTGKLDRLDFADLLQMLAATRKSGKLTLTHHSGQGAIVLRQGKIIYAASNSARETLGNMLLCKGLIDEEKLQRGLEAQKTAAEERRLGAILVELGLLGQEVLEQVMAEQIEKVVSEFLDWHTGFFRFDEFELPDRGEIAIDASHLLLEDGLPPDQVLLGLAHQIDAANRDASETREPRALGEGLAPFDVAVASTEASDTDRLNSLRTIMAEFHSPAFTGEVTLMILNFGQRLVRRGVLFTTSPLGARGIGQFGIDPPAGQSPNFIRQLTIPQGQPSIISEVVARKSVYSGHLEQTAANRHLLQALGGDWPDTIVAAPLIVGGRVVLVFYGDNLPQNDPVGPVDEFDVVMLHAGLAMEKSLLAKRVDHLERLQQRSETLSELESS